MWFSSKSLRSAAKEFTFAAPFPRLLPVRQVFKMVTEDDPAAATQRELARLQSVVRPGMRVAITAGSRGIADLPIVVRAAGEWLKDPGAEPFVVPARGSHGGATITGQIEVLARLGVTESKIGMPIMANGYSS
jgi:hypothetical protein